MRVSRDPSPAEVIRLALAAHERRLRVCLPGRIERYDPAKRSADVKPLIMDVFEDTDGARQVESLPVIPGVPVAFPGGGGFWLTFPVKKGDLCLLLFADASLDRWKSKGGEVDPGEIRPHDLSSAVALVGVLDFAAPVEAHAENVVLGKGDGTRVEITPDGHVDVTADKVNVTSGDIRLGSESASKAVALAPDSDDALTSLHNRITAIETIIRGAPIPEAGMGAPSALQLTLLAAIGPTPAMPPSSVAATKVKAE